jgi:hypothetical protein
MKPQILLEEIRKFLDHFKIFFVTKIDFFRKKKCPILYQFLQNSQDREGVNEIGEYLISYLNEKPKCIFSHLFDKKTL